MTPTEQLLNKLIGFPTVSRDSNLEMIEFIQQYLQQYGIASQLTKNDAATKANLYAVFGPSDSGGVMLSGHTDVVPTESQQWTVDPFSMSQNGSRLYGRGTTDMKGFIASVLAMVPKAVKINLSQPIHLAFSYDEEIGCVGVRRMIDLLESSPERPAFCIIGEPTLLEVGIAHKGKTSAICRCTGVEAHSALVTEGLNAIYLATEMITRIRQIQQEWIALGAKDDDFQVPYSTLHVGTIQGGTALNIIPNHCEFKFEIRNLQEDEPEELLNRLNDAAAEITATYQSKFPQAHIGIEVFNQYPALNTKIEEDVVTYVQKLVSRDNTIKLDFGTEGGLFQNRLGIPTVVCGPGSMQQGHKPDEFIEQSQLAECDRMLDNLLINLSI